jgi:stage II sporulation protein M
MRWQHTRGDNEGLLGKQKQVGEMKNLTKQDLRQSTMEQKRQWAREGVSQARNSIYLAVGIFLVGIWIGAVYPENFGSFFEAVEECLRHRFEGRGVLLTIALIFIGNSMVAFFSILLGVLLGLVPLLSAIVNGVVVGVLFFTAAGSNQLSELWRLIPHGLFELPAIFVAWGLGLWHGTWVFRKDKGETLGNRRRRAFLALFLYVMPLLVIAAIIEGLLAKV